MQFHSLFIASLLVALKRLPALRIFVGYFTVHLLNITVQLLNIAVHLLNITVQLLNITVQLLNIAVQLLNIAVQLLNITVQLLNIVVQLENNCTATNGKIYTGYVFSYNTYYSILLKVGTFIV